MTLRIAVIADAHLTDLYGGYGLFDPTQGHVALRSRADSFGSTRLFNESRAALLACLADIAARGVREVVLLGDMTDDGQPGALQALRAILERAGQGHGLRFHALLGNHDCAGTSRHPVPAPLFDARGAALPEAPEQVMMREDEFCEGLASYGFARPRLWPEDRSYVVDLGGCRLLMLDANLRGSDGTLDPRPAWDAVLATRPAILDQIATQVRAAKAAQVPLLACSHYPMVDFLRADDAASCMSYWAARMPARETSQALAATGLRAHVSGHLHIAGDVWHGTLRNIAMPSPVSFPGGYGLVEVAANGIRAARVTVGAVRGFDVAAQLYGIGHAHYNALIDAHFAELVSDFYFPRDCPGEELRGHHHRDYRRIASGLPVIG